MNDAIQFVRTLQRVPRFGELTDDTQRTIAASAVHRRFRGGQVIYLEGEPADSIYVLESGWIKASRLTREGREQMLMVLQPVEVFGDIAALTGAAYPGTAVALEPVSVWVIPARTILDAIPGHPALATAIIRHMGGRVLHYISLVEDLSLRSVEARLANTLLQNAISSVFAALAIGFAAWSIGMSWGCLRLLGVLSSGLLLLAVAVTVRPSERTSFGLFKYASVYMLAAMLIVVIGVL